MTRLEKTLFISLAVAIVVLLILPDDQEISIDVVHITPPPPVTPPVTVVPEETV